jgi:hypothetical protein
MKLKTIFTTLLLSILVLATDASASESLMNRIQALEPIIGSYPPNIKNTAEADSIKKRYLEIKSELDTLLAATPNEQSLLFMRGHLQSMGHNFDYPDASKGADADLRKLLALNPAHVPAALELAELWVNSNPALAPNAERLFRAAQCYNKDEPLERAQRGIFFALYYQGKMNDALIQSEYLKQTWPQSAQYQRLNAMVLSVLARNNNGKNVKPNIPVKLAMATCN